MSVPHIKRCTLDLQPIPPYNMATGPLESYSNLKELFEERFNEMNNTIRNLQETVVKQNDTVMKALAQVTVLTKSVLHQEVTNNNVRTVFPIQNIDELNLLNNTITLDNRELYINMMKSLLKGRLPKTLTEVLSMSLCMDVNMDGIHGKTRLKDFKAFFQALKDACRSLGSNEVEKDIRNALKIIKKTTHPCRMY